MVLKTPMPPREELEALISVRHEDIALIYNTTHHTVAHWFSKLGLKKSYLKSHPLESRQKQSQAINKRDHKIKASQSLRESCSQKEMVSPSGEIRTVSKEDLEHYILEGWNFVKGSLTFYNVITNKKKSLRFSMYNKTEDALFYLREKDWKLGTPTQFKGIID